MRILTLEETLILVEYIKNLFSNFAKGYVYEGDYRNHPVFQNFFDADSYQEIAGFDTWWMKPYEWIKICSHNFHEEVNAEAVMIRSAPEILDKVLTQIHSHGGKVILTVMGSSFGFPDPQTILFRGLAQLHNMFDKKSKIHLQYFPTTDGGSTLISDDEPHGFRTKLNTETFVFAVTVGPPFKNREGIVDATIIDPERCFVVTREKMSIFEAVSIL